MIRVEQLKKAQTLFEDFRKDMITDRDKAGAVQAFEFCYELAWKAMKKALESVGEELSSAKDTFRKAAKIHLIDDPEIWFDFQTKRNLVSHTYNEQNIIPIIASFELFSAALTMLIKKLEEFNL